MELFAAFDYYNLENYCEISCDNILEIGKKKSLNYTKIKMSKGLNLNDLVYVCFVIETNSNKYLVDCTYKQFFNQNRNLLERIGIPHLSGCDAGVC